MAKAKSTKEVSMTDKGRQMTDVVADFVLETCGDQPGYCVEAGAYDGILENTTLALEQLGWTCLCIEPNPQVFQTLIKNRSLCLEYALAAEKKDGVPFEIYAKPGKHEGSFSAFKVDTVLKTKWAQPLSLHRKRNVVVNAQTLDFCLELVKFPRLDVFSLDVEGWEMEVLKGFDMARWHPKVVIMENIFRDADLMDYLTGYGYERIKRYQFNDFYVG